MHFSPRVFASLLVTAFTLTFASSCEKKSDSSAAHDAPKIAGDKKVDDKKVDDKKVDDAPVHLATMDHNFNTSRYLVDAVVAGDMKIAALYGAEVVRLPMVHEDNPVWVKGLTTVRQAAGAIVDAAQKDDVDGAAKSAGAMLVACAACHRDIGGPPAVAADDPPVGTDVDVKTVKPKVLMAQHQWAADRLLDGLFTPDDANWNAGALALKGAVLVADRDRASETDAVAIETELRADDLSTLKTDADRAAGWSRTVVRCVKCHASMNVKVKSPAPP